MLACSTRINASAGVAAGKQQPAARLGCGLARIAGQRIAAQPAKSSRTPAATQGSRAVRVEAVGTNGSSPSAASPSGSGAYDYDLIIIGCGVGGHGAALHAVECGLTVAVIEGHEIGGTCVNRGCVPSKALLAASNEVRKLRNTHHQKTLGIQLNGTPTFDRQAIADHATNLAANVQGNLARSLESIGVTILKGQAKLTGPNSISYGLPGRVDVGGSATAKDIIIATGSVPFVPGGIEVDGKTVFTSDHALKMEWLPNWIAIIGSGYIGLEFSDVYTALGCEVTFVEAMPNIMPGFDREIAKLAQRLLINVRPIDYHTNVIASKVTPGVPGVKPVRIELTDFTTKEVVDELEVDACLVATGRAPYTNGLNLASVNVETDRRGFIPVNDKMQVLDKAGKPVGNVFCIGDANGKYMLAHAASAQGIAAVETMCGRDRVVNHLAVPAACFTHPEVSFVGLTEDAAKERAEKEGWADKLGVAKTYFKGNSKALAELEGDGMAKMMYRKDSGEIVGVHMIGMHSADNIHEFSNAMNMGQTLRELKFNVHAHPTVAEVNEELIRHASLEKTAVVKPAAAAKQAVAA